MASRVEQPPQPPTQGAPCGVQRDTHLGAPAPAPGGVCPASPLEDPRGPEPLYTRSMFCLCIPSLPPPPSAWDAAAPCTCSSVDTPSQHTLYSSTPRWDAAALHRKGPAPVRHLCATQGGAAVRPELAAPTNTSPTCERSADCSLLHACRHQAQAVRAGPAQRHAGPGSHSMRVVMCLQATSASCACWPSPTSRWAWRTCRATAGARGWPCWAR